MPRTKNPAAAMNIIPLIVLRTVSSETEIITIAIINRTDAIIICFITKFSSGELLFSDLATQM